MSPDPATSPLTEIARHEAGGASELRAELAFRGELRRDVLERAPQAADGVSLLRCDLERAGLASRLPDESATLHDALAAGAGAAAAAALAQTRWSGERPDATVVLSEPGRPPRPIPTGHAGMTWPDWAHGFALACVVRDFEALSVLCLPECIQACALPPERIDAFWPFYCSALAAAAVEPAALPLFADDAERLVARARIADPSVIEDRVRPTLALGRALVAGEPAAFTAALHEALLAHRRHYAEPERAHAGAGQLAFEALALAALAAERGLPLEVESPYLPRDLAAGDFPRTLSRVKLRYPERGIATADEAHWFLDLEGFPRSDRSHVLFESGDRLVARYEARGARGVPHATADFVLADADHGPLPPAALDAGELLFLAESFADGTGAEGEPGEGRARLAEAVACVDAALARIPPGAEAVPAATIRSARGEALYRAEPGRFRLARMTAYRGALLRALERMDAQPEPAGAPAGPGGESDARASAYAAMELIRAQVTPILQAIARDRTGEVARMLRPRDEDYARVFTGEAAEIARRGYEAMWSAPLDLARPSAEQTQLLCYLAPAGMLSEENELSRHFPAGFRGIAHRFHPHRVWVRWKYVRPGETSGIAYDGLVWCDDHWAWFPKPYRVLSVPPA